MYRGCSNVIRNNLMFFPGAHESNSSLYLGYSRRDCLRSIVDLSRPAVPLRPPSTLQCDPQPWLLPCMWAAVNQGHRGTVWPKQGLRWSQKCEWCLLYWLTGSWTKSNTFFLILFHVLFNENARIKNKIYLKRICTWFAHIRHLNYWLESKMAYFSDSMWHY